MMMMMMMIGREGRVWRRRLGIEGIEDMRIKSIVLFFLYLFLLHVSSQPSIKRVNRGGLGDHLLRSSFEFTPGHNNVVIDEAVQVAADAIALNVHEHEGRSDIRCAWGEGTGGTPRVDEELAVLLKAVKAVCVACDQDIAVKLPLEHGKGVRITPRHDIVAVAETDAELLHLNNLCLGPGGGSLRLIKLTADDVHVGGNSAKVIVHLFCAQIAGAEHAVNLSRNKKSLELCRDLMCARRHVHITNHKNQNHCVPERVVVLKKTHTEQQPKKK